MSNFLGLPRFRTVDMAWSCSIMIRLTCSFAMTWGSKKPIECKRLMLCTTVCIAVLSKACGLSFYLALKFFSASDNLSLWPSKVRLPSKIFLSPSCYSSSE